MSDEAPLTILSDPNFEINVFENGTGSPFEESLTNPDTLYDNNDEDKSMVNKKYL